MFPRDRLACLAAFVGLTLLCLLPLPNCFSNVCLPTLFAALLNFFLPLTTSAISIAAISIKSAPTRFAAGTTYLRKSEWLLSQYHVQVHQVLFHAVDQYLYSMESLLVLKQPSCYVVFFKIEYWKLF